MKVLAGLTVLLSVLGIMTALHGAEDSLWCSARLKISILLLALCAGLFAILFLVLF